MRCIFLISAVGLVMMSGEVCGLNKPKYVYHSHENLTTFLNEVVRDYPAIAHLVSIGKSVEDRDMWVLILGNSPETRATLKPDLNLIGNMHGNEAVGREIIVHFIYYLVSNYETNSRVKTLLDSARLQILVSMNPDGFFRSPEGECRSSSSEGRHNVNGFDLNRNFPDYFVDNTEERQPETLAVMKWADNNNFIIHLNLHGGALVANYPYDNYIGGISLEQQTASARISLSREHDVLVYMSKEYTKNHPRMRTIETCVDRNSTNKFEDGIVNGAEWYPIRGSMQDWFYINKGAMAVLVEVSCCKHAPAYELEKFWNENTEPLMDYYETSYKGVRGLVKDSDANALSDVSVHIEGRDDHHQKTTSLGEYWRMLLPGTYKLKFMKSCYQPVQVEVTVPSTGHVRRDIVLTMNQLASSSGTSHVPGAIIAILTMMCAAKAMYY